jgi:hypothetical protein
MQPLSIAGLAANLRPFRELRFLLWEELLQEQIRLAYLYYFLHYLQSEP